MLPVTRLRKKATDRAGLKNRAAFLLGCMAGCLLSSAFYIWWCGLPVACHGARFAAAVSLQPFFRVAEVGPPWTVSNELQQSSKKRLLIAVVASRDGVHEAVSMAKETWASRIETSVEYRIFVAGKGPALPNVHWLRGMRDEEGDIRQLFHVLKHLYSSFADRYHWFLLAPANTYIAVQSIHEMLADMNLLKSVYLGSWASEDPDVMATLHLLPNEYFCEWGPGIIINHAALAAVMSHLDSCKHLSGLFGSHSRHRNRNLTLGVGGDVELGRCFSRRVGIQCTSSQEAQSYFIHDSEGLSLSPDHLWNNRRFQDLLTLYPIRSLEHMRAVHHFVLVRHVHELQLKLAVVENQTNRICERVSLDFAAPLTEPEARYCNVQSFNQCNTTSNPHLVNQVLPQMFKAVNHYEVLPWMYLTPVGLYISTTTTPIFKMNGEIKVEIDFIIKKAISTLNLRETSEWVLWKLVGCHIRYSGTRGREYLLDMVLAAKTGEQTRRQRLKILRPHSADIIVQDDTDEGVLATRVNILVPLNKVGDRFNEFLRIYDREMLRNNENVTLVLIVFGSEVHSVNQTLERYQVRYPEAEFVIVPEEGTFTRGGALDSGMSQLGDSDLAFFCDVDMTFDPTFLDNCRLNAVQGQRVYYPEFFKYYDMNYVYRFKRKPADISIKRFHGHWASYSYGMTCMYKSDYANSGGFNHLITGWGGEDVDLFERVLATGIDILKAPDPSLSHRYHEKTCSLSLPPTQFAMCISSRNEGLADRMQLAEYVYYLEGHCGIRDRPLWT